MQNQIKSRQVTKFRKILTLNIAMKQNRLIKRNEKKLLRKDTLRVSQAVIQRYHIKKVSLKILPPVYLHIIEIDIR